MKRFLYTLTGLLLYCSPGKALAQSEADETAIMASIATFFDGFKEKDAVKMQSVTDPGARLVITASDSSGNPVMRPVSMDEFYGFITQSTARIVETYWNPEIYVNDNLASVWIDYNLWVDNRIDHCGKDNFQLFRSQEGWKIIAIADTQRKVGCKPHDVGGPSRGDLYEQGIDYDDFLAGVAKRKKMWRKNDAAKKLTTNQLERVRLIEGKWHLLAVAEDRCSDSANTIPYLSVLLDEMDNLSLRIVDSDRGQDVLEDHHTPDGRSATPTVILLDEDYREVGAWVERPAELQEWAMENRGGMSSSEFLEAKFAWYDKDSGRQTVDEIISLIEAAAGR